MARRFQVLNTSIGNNLTFGPHYQGAVVSESDLAFDGKSQVERLLDIKAVKEVVPGESPAAVVRNQNGTAALVSNPVAASAPGAIIALLQSQVTDLQREKAGLQEQVGGLQGEIAELQTALQSSTAALKDGQQISAAGNSKAAQ